VYLYDEIKIGFSVLPLPNTTPLFLSRFVIGKVADVVFGSGSGNYESYFLS